MNLMNLQSGIYVMETVNEEQYLNHLNTIEDKIDITKKFKSTKHRCNKKYLILREKTVISSYNFLMNLIVGERGKFLPEFLIKNVYDEKTSREKYPEMFL